MLLCVPDGEIAAAAAAVARGPLVGHCSGATGLEPLAPHEAFSLHPLMTVPAGARPDVLVGAGCAVDGGTPRALAAAEALAGALGMRAMRVEDADRTAYHAAASIAANFLVTLEGAAERLAATAGVDRALLAPLVRAAVEDWAALGAERALTGPIARGDEETVERQRAAVAERTPDLLPLFDVLVTRRGRWRCEDHPHRPRDARPRRRCARPRQDRRPRADDGRLPRRPPLADARGPRALRRGGRLAVRQPGAVQRLRRPRRLPRSEDRDAAEAAELGVDVLYAPAVEEVYPPGFATSVRVEGLSDVLEGAERGPEHFAGVCTVVTKLLNVVEPDVAFFGQKDAQQVAVLRRMVRDLDLPVELAVLPTIREPDGVRSCRSRNRLLAPDERRRAVALSQALQAAESAVAAGARDPAAIAAAARAEMNGVEPEYLALVDPDSFQPVRTVDGRVLVAVAARIGATRLIDNTIVQAATPPRGADHIGEEEAMSSAPRHDRKPVTLGKLARDACARRADRDGDRLRPPERG